MKATSPEYFHQKFTNIACFKGKKGQVTNTAIGLVYIHKLCYYVEI